MGFLVLAFTSMVDQPTADATNWPSLVTWVGVIVFGFVSVIRGWLVPKASHEREIAILEENHEKVVAALREQLANKTVESGEWRGAYQAEQAVSRERDAQHRLALETGKTTTRAIEQIRDGVLEQATKDVTP